MLFLIGEECVREAVSYCVVQSLDESADLTGRTWAADIELLAVGSSQQGGARIGLHHPGFAWRHGPDFFDSLVDGSSSRFGGFPGVEFGATRQQGGYRKEAWKCQFGESLVLHRELDGKDAYMLSTSPDG